MNPDAAVLLPVRADGDPFPSVRCVHRNASIVWSSRSTREPLTTSALLEHRGMYDCELRNAAGVAEFEFLLSVNGTTQQYAA